MPRFASRTLASRPVQSLSFAALLLSALALSPTSTEAQQAKAATASAATTTATAPTKPIVVEWVYRVKYGYHDEWWTIFRKYQIAILERQKQLGFVKEYTVYAPSLHTSEDARWDYRVIIVRTAYEPPPGQSESEVAKQLFPDQTAFNRDENRRWELTANHWDLPIHVVAVTAAGE